MNLAIVILFWSLLGWKFAFAEFFGGVIIIAVVTLGLTLTIGGPELARLGSEYRGNDERDGEDHCHHCDSAHEDEERRTWGAVAATALADVKMLRNELVIGYLIAGFAAALIPTGVLATVLSAVGSVPVIGYVLLLVAGLLIAVATFVCSMGNVPIARYLAAAGIPLGANTTFIYGDLLIAPLIGIYRKSFPSRIAWTFIGFFIAGAIGAGALMERLIGNGPIIMAAGSMSMNDRFTLVANLVAIAAVIAVAIAARIQPKESLGANS